MIPRSLFAFVLLVLLSLTNACSSNLVDELDDKDTSSGQTADVLVLNEGLFRRGTGSITGYSSNDESVVGVELSVSAPIDVLQSAIELSNDRLLIVSNNTNRLHILDANTLVEIDSFAALGSPRYAAAFGDTLIVTDLYAGKLLYLDIETRERKSIRFPGEGAEIIRSGHEAIVSAPQAARIYRYKPATHNLVDSIAVGCPVTSIVSTAEGNILLASGARDTIASGYLKRLSFGDRSLTTLAIFEGSAATFYPRLATTDSQLAFVLQADLYSFDSAASPTVELKQLTDANGTIYYGLGYDRRNSHLYLADAKGYIGNGVVYTLDVEGNPVDTFGAGPLPNGFVFREN